MVLAPFVDEFSPFVMLSLSHVQFLHIIEEFFWLPSLSVSLLLLELGRHGLILVSPSRSDS